VTSSLGPRWQDAFVEELGALGPELGIPRAMMRVTAWMMICDPPEQSAPQIQSGLRLSAGSVSAATRQLIAAGMLERVSRPGDRRIYYRIASGSWDAPLRAKLAALSRLRQVAERAIDTAGNQADYRLREMRDSFAWFEDQLDRFIKQRNPDR
jgi:DNA-binding transcriptional regulator GbsR (MarR family)